MPTAAAPCSQQQQQQALRPAAGPSGRGRPPQLLCGLPGKGTGGSQRRRPQEAARGNQRQKVSKASSKQQRVRTGATATESKRHATPARLRLEAGPFRACTACAVEVSVGTEIRGTALPAACCTDQGQNQRVRPDSCEDQLEVVHRTPHWAGPRQNVAHVFANEVERAVEDALELPFPELRIPSVVRPK